MHKKKLKSSRARLANRGAKIKHACAGTVVRATNYSANGLSIVPNAVAGARAREKNLFAKTLARMAAAVRSSGSRGSGE